MAHTKVRTGVYKSVRTLVIRADVLCSSNAQKEEKRSISFKPCWSMHTQSKQVVERFSRHEIYNTRRDYKATITLPYIQGTYGCFLSQVDIRGTLKPCTTLGKLLVYQKDSFSVEKKANVVYRIPCQTCPKVYIWQTYRHSLWRQAYKNIRHQ